MVNFITDIRLSPLLPKRLTITLKRAVNLGKKQYRVSILTTTYTNFVVKK
ncbi:hypothetical protein PspMM1_10920 [Pseudoalteromonas sp. MM1]|nr:hypothetical protein PspMM1_10920 [Pseudoalteromonas sp. MM1]